MEKYITYKNWKSGGFIRVYGDTKTPAFDGGSFILVGAAGFEPTTTRPPDVCATRLRYAPMQSPYILYYFSI